MMYFDVKVVARDAIGIAVVMAALMHLTGNAGAAGSFLAFAALPVVLAFFLGLAR